MIVAVGGRSFTGKSTLARALAEAIPGVLLDKAALRKLLFPNLAIASREVSDCLYEWLLKAASWNLDTSPGTVIVLDGRPLTRNRDVLSLRRFASSLGHALHIVECVCPEGVALERAESMGAVGAPEMSGTGDGAEDPIPEPKIVVDTCQPVQRCVSTVLERVIYQQEAGGVRAMHPS
ncbi:AAA family ATPase [Streptomyces goshikiensis]|uniref:AAA family ATPase n=1 Tax=Streptomyces goshikiensis TaxID=1942 RepID=UPI00379C623C